MNIHPPSIRTRYPLFLLLSLCCSLTTIAQENGDDNEWSGTATYITRSVSKSASSGSHSADEGTTFTEYKMEANVVKGKGTGSALLVIKNTSKHSEWYTGRKTSSAYTENGTANASAPTELSVSITDDGKNYSFAVYIPACSGILKKTETSGGGSSALTTTREIGQDEGMIQVEFQEMKYPDVLSGEIIDRIDNEYGYTESITKWMFTKKPIQAELIITPEDYDDWLPEPGASETDPGATMLIGLKVQEKGGKELAIKAKSFTIKLVNTSNEPGIALNYPLKTTGEALPDLRLVGTEERAANNKGQEITIPPDGDNTASVQLASYDGGGYTILQAEAVLVTGQTIKGELLKAGGAKDVPIPKRAAGRLIGAAWLKKAPSASDQEDKETSPGNTNNGDGLTAYEEYRGIFSKGKFIRLNNKKKDLGVFMKEVDLPYFSKGLTLLANAAGIDVTPLLDKELDTTSRIFNMHRKSASNGIQHALVLMNKDLTDKNAGFGFKGTGINLPKSKYGKTIAQSTRTLIDVNEITRLYHGQLKVNQDANEPMPYTLEDDLSNTVAHELAHGLNVYHHGEGAEDALRPLNMTGTGIPVLAFGSSGSQLKDSYWPANQERPIKLTGQLGVPQSEASGDLSCIMAYTNYYQWARKMEKGSYIHYYSVPQMPVGKKFCTSPQATGINLKGYFGNAQAAPARGNCLAQLKVKAY